VVRNVRIRGSSFVGNAGVGVYVHRALGLAVTTAWIEDNLVEANDQGIVAAGVEGVVIRGNRVRDHRSRGRSGIALGEGTIGASVLGNELSGNFRGIVSAGATRVAIRDNTIEGTGPGVGAGAGEDGDGIVCRGLRSLLDDACAVTGNSVRRTAGSGLVVQLVSRVELLDNAVEEAGQRGLYLVSATQSQVRGNHVSRIGLEAPGRYDGIELARSANYNQITSNVCRLGGSMRNAIGIGAGCIGNVVASNTVLP
jgi:nitrous oxidase accessory protein NosD